MPTVHVREVQANQMTDVELQSVADLLTAAHRILDPSDPPWSVSEARNELHPGDLFVAKRRLVASLDDQTVGMATIELESKGGNQRIADVMVEVHPNHCRRGVGTALVTHGLDIANVAQRSSFIGWGIRSDGSDAFWTGLGLPEVAVERLSRLRIDDVDRELMARWRTDSAARQRGYALTRWTSPCPDELMALFVAAQQGMNDAPLDDLDMEHPVVDEDWNRVREQSFHERNMSLKVLLALDPDGNPAAMTEVILFEDRPWFVSQQGTTTLAQHRNQGLGRWLKAEMFEDLATNHPECQVIETGNATSNASMLSINTEMGFRPHVELTVRQAPTVAVEEALNAYRRDRRSQ